MAVKMKMDGKLYRKIVVLNRIGWAMVIISVIAFFALALVCKYRQVHYNASTGDFFGRGFFCLSLLLSSGLLIGFPKTFCDAVENLKAAETKRKRAVSIYRLVNLGLAFLGTIFLLVVSILLSSRNGHLPVP